MNKHVTAIVDRLTAVREAWANREGLEGQIAELDKLIAELGKPADIEGTIKFADEIEEALRKRAAVGKATDIPKRSFLEVAGLGAACRRALRHDKPHEWAWELDSQGRRIHGVFRGWLSQIDAAVAFQESVDRHRAKA